MHFSNPTIHCSAHVSKRIFSYFRFLPRLSVILATAETVRDILLPDEITVHDKWLPAVTVRGESWRTLNMTDSLDDYILSYGLTRRNRQIECFNKMSLN